MQRLPSSILLQYQNAGSFCEIGIVLNHHGRLYPSKYLTQRNSVIPQFVIAVRRNDHISSGDKPLNLNESFTHLRNFSHRRREKLPLVQLPIGVARPQ
jgi:hypothetical protein